MNGMLKRPQTDHMQDPDSATNRARTGELLFFLFCGVLI